MSESSYDEIKYGPIYTQEQYESALERAKECYQSEPGSDQNKRFEIIMSRLEDYERKNNIEPQDKWHKCLRIAGRLAALHSSHCPPPWRTVQLDGFFAETFLVGQTKHIGARIMGGLSGMSSNNALCKLPEDVEWLLKQVWNQLEDEKP